MFLQCISVGPRIASAEAHRPDFECRFTVWSIPKLRQGRLFGAHSGSGSGQMVRFPLMFRFDYGFLLLHRYPHRIIIGMVFIPLQTRYCLSPFRALRILIIFRSRAPSSGH